MHEATAKGVADYINGLDKNIQRLNVRLDELSDELAVQRAQLDKLNNDLKRTVERMKDRPDILETR